jgi:hypothetical protein
MSRRQTAAEAYAERLERIQRLLAKLNEVLEYHQADHAAQPRDWTLVGDLGLIQDSLEDLLEGWGVD